MADVTSVEQLEALYEQPGEASLVKEADRITPLYRRLIEASPFMALATVGPDGLDCSPRAELWNPARHVDEKALPTPGQILAEMSEARVGGEAYDREWPERARRSLW